MRKNQKEHVAARMIATVAKKMADVSCGVASAYGVYQPKEPKKIK